MLDDLFEESKLQLCFYGLFQGFETPVALLRLQRWYLKELFDCIIGVGELQCFCGIVLVLDVDISRIIFVVFFVLKVVPAQFTDALIGISRCLLLGKGKLWETYSSSESCIKSSSDMFALLCKVPFRALH